MDRVTVKYEFWWYLILSLFIFFSFYFAIGAYPLFDNNEGLYASIAKFMLLHKKFIIPYLNCVPYIEKPPLLYWLLSSSFSIFGFTAFAARFITTTSAALTCVAIVFFAKKIKRLPTGIIGALIFTSSIGVSIIARMVYFDMLFTFLISCALFCLFYWYESQKTSILKLSYLFLGLAVLTKGLMAIILIFGSFILFLILEKEFRKLYKILDPMGITIFLVIVLPWHLAAIVQHKGFFRHYIIEEHFLRFLNQREPHDYYNGPIYYYLPRIMIYLFPWSLFMPLIFWRIKNIDVTLKQLLRFSWCWLLVPLAFFSFSNAKANYYMIVSVPALAMILGIKINNLLIEHPKVFSIWSTVILFTTTLIFDIGYFFFPNNFVIVIVIYSLIVGIITLLSTTQRFDTTARRLHVLLCKTAASLSCLFAGEVMQDAKHERTWTYSQHSENKYSKRSTVYLVVIILASLIIPVVITMVSYIKVIKGELSTEEVGVYLASQAQNKSIYIYQDFENISALSFYASNCFKIIDSKSNDLYYGKKLPEFKQWFIGKEELLHNISKEQIYIIVPIKKLQQFYQAMNQVKFSLLKKFDRIAIIEAH